MVIKSSEPVIIAGAGIAGLSTALSLAKFGIPTIIYEKARRLGSVGAGIQLAPNATRILAQLGILKSLEKHAIAPEKIVIFSDISSKKIAEIKPQQQIAKRDGLPYLVVHRAQLQAVLVAAVNLNPLIQLKLDHQVREIIPLSNGSNQAAAIIAGCDYDERRLTDLAIIADGVNSRLRNGVASHQTAADNARYSGFTAWRTMVSNNATPPGVKAKHGSSVLLWFGRGFHLVEYSLGEQINLVLITKGSSGGNDTRALDGGRLASLIVPKSNALKARLAVTKEWSGWPIYGYDHPLWSSGNCALVGDAAHAMVPFSAQGAVAAIEDGWILAKCLAKGGTVTTALADYAGLRADRVRKIAKTSLVNGQIYHLSPPLAQVRDKVIEVIGARAMLKRMSYIYDYIP